MFLLQEYRSSSFQAPFWICMNLRSGTLQGYLALYWVNRSLEDVRRFGFRLYEWQGLGLRIHTCTHCPYNRNANNSGTLHSIAYLAIIAMSWHTIVYLSTCTLHISNSIIRTPLRRALSVPDRLTILILNRVLDLLPNNHRTRISTFQRPIAILPSMLSM